VDHLPPSLNFLQSPLAICVLSLVASAGGGVLRDRLSIEGRDSTSAAKIEALSDRVSALEHSSLPAAQFRDFQESTKAQLDDIRQDIRKLLARP
jgi:hypothetical protein